MRRRWIGWLLCVLAALEMFLFSGGAGAAALLAVSLLLPPCLALALLPAYRAELSLKLPDQALRGEEVLCELSARRESRLPMPRIRCLVETENLLTGEREELRVMLPARWSLVSAHSGVLEVRILRAELVDWFGLFVKRVPWATEASVTVTVQPCPAEFTMEMPDDPVSEGERYSDRRPGNDPTETFRIREYVPGDPVRQIHWKLSQKTDRVLVREFALPLGGRVSLTLESAPVSLSQGDEAMDLLFSLGEKLCRMGVPCSVSWRESGEERNLQITEQAEWDAFQRQLLSTRMEPVQLRAEGLTIL